MSEFSESLTSTKFIMSAVCLIMVFVAFMSNKLNSDTFMPFILGILGTYTVGNTVSKFADKNSAN